MDHSLLLLSLFLTLSLQIHARESMFFSKTTRFEASPTVSSTASIAEEPVMNLPPQSRNGYGLYGRDPDQFPSTTTTKYNSKDAAFREPSNTPSTFGDAQYYQNSKERYPDNIPSSFDDTEFENKETYPANSEFSAENNNVNYKERYPDNIPSGFTDTESSSSTDQPRYESKERYNYAKNNPSSFSRTEYSNSNNYIPSTFSDEEFNQREDEKVPDFSKYDKQYGMSDTRVLENGKYFYDVNAEKNSRKYEPAVKGSSGYGNSGRGNGYDEYNKINAGVVGDGYDP